MERELRSQEDYIYELEDYVVEYSEEDYPEGWPWPVRPLPVGAQILLPTATGVVSFDRDDLSRSPGRLPLGPDVPQVHIAEVHRVEGGVVAVSPFTRSRDVVYQYWRDAR